MSIIAASALLAFSIALPFGPISLLCVQKSLRDNAWRGLACGAGASTAHGLFAALAVVGANAVAGRFTGWLPGFQLLAGAMLIGVGIKMITRPRKRICIASVTSAGLADYFAGLTLALSNPGTIFPYLGLAGSGLYLGQVDIQVLTATVTGVLLGSATCYAALSGSAWALRDRLPHQVLSGLNFVAGPILIGMGLHLVIQG